MGANKLPTPPLPLSCQGLVTTTQFVISTINLAPGWKRRKDIFALLFPLRCLWSRFARSPGCRIRWLISRYVCSQAIPFSPLYPLFTIYSYLFFPDWDCCL